LPKFGELEEHTAFLGICDMQNKSEKNSGKIVRMSDIVSRY